MEDCIYTNRRGKRFTASDIVSGLRKYREEGWSRTMSLSRLGVSERSAYYLAKKFPEIGAEIAKFSPPSMMGGQSFITHALKE